MKISKSMRDDDPEESGMHLNLNTVVESSKTVAGLILAAAVILAALLQFGLLKLPVELIGNPTDSASALWNLWWPQYSLRVADDMLVHAYHGAPYVSNHLSEMVIFQSMLYAILRLILTPITAFNLIIILSQIATQLSIYFFLRHKSISFWGALLGSLAIVLSPWYTAMVHEANLAALSLWWLPLALLIWDKWVQNSGMGWSALLIGALFCAVLSGLSHLVWISLVFLPYAIYPLWNDPSKERKQSALIMLFLFLGLLMIYPLALINRTLMGWEPLYIQGAMVPKLTVFKHILKSSPAIVGGLLIALLTYKGERKHLSWLVVFGVMFAMSMGLLPEPFAYLLGFPILDQPTMLFGVALLVGELFLLPEFEQNPRQPFQWGIGLALVFLTNFALYRPLPAYAPVIPPIFADIAAEPEDYLILDYPFGVLSEQDNRLLGAHPENMQYTVWHHKRTLSGIAGYYPPVNYERFQEMAFLFPQDRIPKAASQLQTAVDEWRIGYVVVHLDQLGEAELEATRSLIDKSESLCTVYEDPTYLIYRAAWHPYSCAAQENE